MSPVAIKVWRRAFRPGCDAWGARLLLSLKARRVVSSSALAVELTENWNTLLEAEPSVAADAIAPMRVVVDACEAVPAISNSEITSLRRLGATRRHSILMGFVISCCEPRIYSKSITCE